MNPDAHIHALPRGSMIGHFRIERLLGKKGGFAFTYLALDTRLRRPVALKELFPNGLVVRQGTNVMPIAKDKETTSMWSWALRKFKEEARHLARFRHPNIVVVSDLIEANQTAYIVMHYVEGRSLDEILKEMGHPVKEGFLMHVLNGVLSGLEAVHKEGILHRDIKPNNIYLTRRGDVILLDFGAARPQVRVNQQSEASFCVHADGYSPFEQYSLMSRLTPATDIYAVAATMVRAISGERPPSATDRSIHENYVPLVHRFRGYYSPELLEGIDAGMAIEATKRPSSVSEWRSMLSRGGRPRQAKGGRPVAFWVMLLSFLLIGILVAWGIIRMGSEEEGAALRGTGGGRSECLGSMETMLEDVIPGMIPFPAFTGFRN